MQEIEKRLWQLLDGPVLAMESMARRGSWQTPTSPDYAYQRGRYDGLMEALNLVRHLQKEKSNASRHQEGEVQC